ncbi:MAG: outer membrane beta-barrel protein [Terracidiphilus sp.]|jgi:outer membrane immunogenic protein
MKKFFAIAVIAVMTHALALAQTTGQNRNIPTNWTGFYAGLNTGGVFGSSNAQTKTVYSEDGYFDSADVSVVNSTGNMNLHPTGFTGGLQFGYNLQIAKWVLGAEADYGVLAASRTSSGVGFYTDSDYGTFTITQTVSTDWMSSARARVGRTLGNRALLFATGGAAETVVRYSSLFTDNYENYNEAATPKVLKTGWIIGGGAEYALNRHWSARAEYLYADFGKVSNAGDVLADVWDDSYPASIFTHTATLKSNIGRIAINYRF